MSKYCGITSAVRYSVFDIRHSQLWKTICKEKTKKKKGPRIIQFPIPKEVPEDAGLMAGGASMAVFLRLQPVLRSLIQWMPRLQRMQQRGLKPYSYM